MRLDTSHQKGALRLDASNQNSAMCLDALYQKGAMRLDASHQKVALRTEASAVTHVMIHAKGYWISSNFCHPCYHLNHLRHFII